MTGRMRMTVLAAAGLLSACASRPAEVAVIAAPPPPPPPAPVAPQGYTASIVLPPQGADGGFRTLNAGIGADEAVWHLRAALNVAALGCRDAASATLTGDYNALLAAQKPGLVRAQAAMQARFAAAGAGWQGSFDREMTRLYNFFAQPQAQDGFCTTAATIAHDARFVRPDQLQSFAAMALPALEAPFVAYYREVAAYRAATMQHQQLALATIAPAAPVATAYAPPVAAAPPRLGYDATILANARQ